MNRPRLGARVKFRVGRGWSYGTISYLYPDERKAQIRHRKGDDGGGITTWTYVNRSWDKLTKPSSTELKQHSNEFKGYSGPGWIIPN